MHSCSFLYFKSFLMYHQSKYFCERSTESETKGHQQLDRVTQSSAITLR